MPRSGLSHSPGDSTLNPGHLHQRGVHESQVVQGQAGQGLQALHHGRALQGEQPAVLQQLQGDILPLHLHLLLLCAHQRDVLLPPARVAHHVEVVVRLGDDEVVHDAPVGQGEDGEAALVRLQPGHVRHSETFHEADAVFPVHLLIGLGIRIWWQRHYAECALFNFVTLVVGKETWNLDCEHLLNKECKVEITLLWSMWETSKREQCFLAGKVRILDVFEMRNGGGDDDWLPCCGDVTKTDEFSEKFQTVFDPPPIFWKTRLHFFMKKTA